MVYVLCQYSFILTVPHQKAFILGPKAPIGVSIHSVRIYPRVHALGVGLEVKMEDTFKLWSTFILILILTFVGKSLHTWTIDTLKG